MERKFISNGEVIILPVDFLDNRVIVVDVKTGEILDDAMGKGFQNIEIAFEAYFLDFFMEQNLEKLGFLKKEEKTTHKHKKYHRRKKR